MLGGGGDGMMVWPFLLPGEPFPLLSGGEDLLTLLLSPLLLLLTILLFFFISVGAGEIVGAGENVGLVVGTLPPITLLLFFFFSVGFIVSGRRLGEGEIVCSIK